MCVKFSLLWIALCKIPQVLGIRWWWSAEGGPVDQGAPLRELLDELLLPFSKQAPTQQAQLPGFHNTGQLLWWLCCCWEFRWQKSWWSRCLLDCQQQDPLRRVSCVPVSLHHLWILHGLQVKEQANKKTHPNQPTKQNNKRTHFSY